MVFSSKDIQGFALRPTTLKLSNPLQLSILISGLTFLCVFVAVVSMLSLSWKENKIFVRALSQSLIKAHFEQIKEGDYRNFTESIIQEFPNLHLKIKEQDRILFEFQKKEFSAACSTTFIDKSSISKNLSIYVCKPFRSSFYGIIPIAVCFLLVLAGIMVIALNAEESSRRSLQKFMKEAGLKFREKTSFGETLVQLGSLQKEFIRLKKRMAEFTEQKARSKIAAYLAHDLRSPLLVFQEVLRVENENELTNLKPKLLASICRVHSMINSLNEKDLKTITPYEISNFDLQTVIDEAKLQARNHKIRFHSQIEQGRTYVLDKDKIERAVANLLHNAIAFCSTYVSVRMFSKEQKLYIQVFDDGHGVPQEFDEMIYQEQFTFGRSQGTGLGLSYAKDVVTAHKGILRHFRRGNLTVFEMVLPLYRERLQISPIPIMSVLQKQRDLCLSAKGAEVLPVVFNQYRTTKGVLIVLKDSVLKKSLRKKALTKKWVFQTELPHLVELKAFGVVYSDIPEVISVACKEGLKTIVASDSDSCEKALLKISRVLGSL